MFTIIGIIGLLITEFGMWVGEITRFHVNDQIYESPEMLTKCFSTGIVLVWNYIARKIIIFK